MPSKLIRTKQDLLGAAQHENGTARYRLQRASAEYRAATVAWEAAGCPDEGDLAYAYARAAHWHEHCQQSARRVAEALVRAKIAVHAAGSLVRRG